MNIMGLGRIALLVSHDSHWTLGLLQSKCLPKETAFFQPFQLCFSPLLTPCPQRSSLKYRSIVCITLKWKLNLFLLFPTRKPNISRNPDAQLCIPLNVRVLASLWFLFLNILNSCKSFLRYLETSICSVGCYIFQLWLQSYQHWNEAIRNRTSNICIMRERIAER